MATLVIPPWHGAGLLQAVWRQGTVSGCPQGLAQARCWLSAEAGHMESHGSAAGTRPAGSLLSFMLLLF